MYKKIKILIFFSFAVINCNAQFSSTDFIPYFDGSSWTYADRDMNLQFFTRYLKASLFNEGFGIVEKTKNTYVKINNLGEEVSKSSLEEYNKFNNVKVYYSTTGIVTDTGELGLGDMAFSTTSNVRQTSSKEVVVTKKGNKYGYEKMEHLLSLLYTRLFLALKINMKIKLE